MTSFGMIIAAIEATPRELMRDPSIGPADLRLVAIKLDHAAAQCRTLAECQPEPVQRRGAIPLRRDRAC